MEYIYMHHISYYGLTNKANALGCPLTHDWDSLSKRLNIRIA